MEVVLFLCILFALYYGGLIVSKVAYRSGVRLGTQAGAEEGYTKGYEAGYEAMCFRLRDSLGSAHYHDLLDLMASAAMRPPAWKSDASKELEIRKKFEA